MNIQVSPSLFEEMISELQAYKTDEPIAVYGKDIVANTIRQAEELVQAQFELQHSEP